MTARPPILDRAHLTDAQREVHDRILTGPRGIVEGPLRVWLQSPEMAAQAQEFGAFCRYRTRLPPALSELAIIIVGAYWQAGFEWAIHAPTAERAGVSRATIEAIRTGREPDHSSEAAEMVWRVSTETLHHHRLSDETWSRAAEVIGVPALVDLIAVLGYYTLICMTIRVFQVPLPEGAENPFPEA